MALTARANKRCILEGLRRNTGEIKQFITLAAIEYIYPKTRNHKEE